jgi:hypothetical protein
MKMNFRKWFALLSFLTAIMIMVSCGGGGGGSDTGNGGGNGGGGGTPPSSTKAITAFSFTNPAVTGVINESAKTIAVTMAHGTNVTALVATFAQIGMNVKVGSTIQTSGQTPNNFTNPVTYTVTAQDNSTASYKVTVTVAPGSGTGTGVIKLPKTGQTTCYDSAGAVIVCAGTGQDGASQIGVTSPNPRFTTNADTSITDNLTGLAWSPNGNLMPTRDPGWDTDGTLPIKDDGLVTWQHALDYVAKLNAENYLGHNDWRLPNRRELKSLVNYGQPDTIIWLNTQGFTNNAQTSGSYYWSSNTYARDTNDALYFELRSGAEYFFPNPKYNGSGYVWPVRAGQNTGAPAELPKTGQTNCYDVSGFPIPCTNTGQDGEYQYGVAWPNPRFTANADTTVTDNLTGLFWPSIGNFIITWRDPGFDNDGVANDGRVTWQHALDYVAKLNAENYLGYNDWRLPNVNELESLVNSSQSDGVVWLASQGINFDHWSNLFSPQWTSTTATPNALNAWEIDLYNGTVVFVPKTGLNYVIPVRGGQ